MRFDILRESLSLDKLTFLKTCIFFPGTFSPSVCQYIAKRKHENHNSGVLAWVTSISDDSRVGIVELNDFVFNENPR